MRLLLVEDDKTIASFVRKGLEAAGFAVDHADDGEEGLHLAVTEPYDAAIIDLMLPKLDGLTLINRLRKENINTPVIILSAKGSIDDRVKGLQTGSDDYLTKPFAFSELLARVQALVRRATGTSEPTTLTLGDLAMNLITREVSRADRKIELQPREFSLLEYLMRNAGKALLASLPLAQRERAAADPVRLTFLLSVDSWRFRGMMYHLDAEHAQCRQGRVKNHDYGACLGLSFRSPDQCCGGEGFQAQRQDRQGLWRQIDSYRQGSRVCPQGSIRLNSDIPSRSG